MTGAGSPHLKTRGPSIRLLHWGLALSVATAWVTHDGPGWLHDGTGYASLGLAGLRIVIGFMGDRENRFRTFVAGFGSTLGYLRAILVGREPRYIGHNPLGGWMILALLGFCLAAGLTGWLYTTDRFWGLAWMEALHGYSADILLALIAAHVLGVIFTSIRQGENLVAAMIHGRKRLTTARHPEDPIRR